MDIVSQYFLRSKLKNKFFKLIEDYIENKQSLNILTLNVYYGVGIEEWLKKAATEFQENKDYAFWELYNNSLNNSKLILINKCILTFKKYNEFCQWDGKDSIFTYSINNYTIVISDENDFLDGFNIINEELKNYIH